MPNKSDPTLKTGWVQGSNLASWMAYSALQLVYGHIPGAMMTEDLLFVLENSAGALALWRDMMRVRADARDFLVFGQMLRPPAATVPLKSVEMCGNKPIETYPCCPVPEVAATVFKAKNGSVALIVANIANATVDYSAIVDLGGGKHTNVSVSMPPTSARAVLLNSDDETAAEAPWSGTASKALLMTDDKEAATSWSFRPASSSTPRCGPGEEARRRQLQFRLDFSCRNCLQSSTCPCTRATKTK